MKFRRACSLRPSRRVLERTEPDDEKKYLVSLFETTTSKTVAYKVIIFIPRRLCNNEKKVVVKNVRDPDLKIKPSAFSPMYSIKYIPTSLRINF
jgi:hypothetical protein